MSFKWLFTIEFIFIIYLKASKDIPNIDDITKVEEKTEGSE